MGKNDDFKCDINLLYIIIAIATVANIYVCMYVQVSKEIFCIHYTLDTIDHEKELYSTSCKEKSRERRITTGCFPISDPMNFKSSQLAITIGDFQICPPPPSFQQFSNQSEFSVSYFLSGDAENDQSQVYYQTISYAQGRCLLIRNDKYPIG